jgi:hypothetical protein
MSSAKKSTARAVAEGGCRSRVKRLKRLMDVERPVLTWNAAFRFAFCRAAGWLAGWLGEGAAAGCWLLAARCARCARCALPAAFLSAM